jgi:hypothetical protein
MDELHKLFQHLRAGVLRVVFLGEGRDFFEAHESLGFVAESTEDIPGRRVVRHAIDPGAERAPRLVELEAFPDFEVDFLEEVLAAIRIGLVGLGKSSQCAAVFHGNLLIQNVAIRS